MKYLLIVLLSILMMACVSKPIQQVDRTLELRITQMENSFSKVKSETIAEAKEAAADLVAKATDKFEATGKEVIRHAADQLGEKLDVAIDKVDKALDRQRQDTLKEVHELVKNDVPTAIRESVVQSADKIAERLGVSKQTVPGPDGIPMEVWVLGGSGLAGFLGTFGKSIYRYFTRRKREDEDEEWLEEKVDEKLTSKLASHPKPVQVIHGTLPAGAPCPDCSGPVLPSN